MNRTQTILELEKSIEELSNAGKHLKDLLKEGTNLTNTFLVLINGKDNVALPLSKEQLKAKLSQLEKHIAENLKKSREELNSI